MKIKINKNKCFGCGTCQILAGQTFEIGSDGKSALKKEPHNKEEEIISVARACPAGAIEIYNDEEERL